MSNCQPGGKKIWSNRLCWTDNCSYQEDSFFSDWYIFHIFKNSFCELHCLCGIWCSFLLEGLKSSNDRFNYFSLFWIFVDVVDDPLCRLENYGEVYAEICKIIKGETNSFPTLQKIVRIYDVFQLKKLLKVFWNILLNFFFILTTDCYTNQL